ncbi:WAP four-disulfide core domain protein 18 [Anabarilius grahami]|uniref:WAP four-disulfide core domain protein 18 n=1 Tax=Anabarilius grahami TaxID=495550 RepID=A0A3N0YFL0_ANAGA|nr:WAP four-disulfide core domain protein 18 [Anabarilius grahami]
MAKEVSEESFYLGAGSNKNESEEAKWTVLLKIGDTPVSFKIDTGADVTVMNMETFEKLHPRAQLLHSNIVLDSPGGSLNCIGQFTAEAEHKRRKYAITVYVVAGETVSNLLSRQTAAEMEFIVSSQVERMTARVFCSLSAVLLCLSACLSTTDAGVAAAKPGQCPSKTSGVKKCGELCAYDRDCPNNEKCCSDGCGHQCMPPYTVKPAAEPPKPPVKPVAEPPKPPVKPAAEPPKPPVKPPVKPVAEPPKPPVKPAAEPPKPPVCGGSYPQPPYRGDGHGGKGHDGKGRGHGGKGRGRGHDCD